MYEQLYAQNRGLLHKLAQRWRDACERDRAVSVEDLEQASFFGLVKAAQTYDATAGKAWPSWAAWFIFREFESALCLRQGMAMQPHTGAFALDAPLPSEDADGATYGDMLEDESAPDAAAEAIRGEVCREVRAAVERLGDAEQRQVIRLHDLEGMSYIETAEALEISEGHVRTLRHSAHNALRKDKRLKALRDEEYLDDYTRFYAHKGVAAFERDLTSVTEGAALWRVEQRERLQNDRRG